MTAEKDESNGRYVLRSRAALIIGLGGPKASGPEQGGGP